MDRQMATSPSHAPTPAHTPSTPTRVSRMPRHLCGEAGRSPEARVHDNRIQLVTGWGTVLQENVTRFLFLATIHTFALSDQKGIKNCNGHNKNTGEQVFRASVNKGAE